jgi:hypothetical protein
MAKHEDTEFRQRASSGMEAVDIQATTTLSSLPAC